MILFRHRNCDKNFTPATFAYICPTPYQLEKIFTEAQENIMIPVGVTYLHRLDNYCKATGRTKAYTKMTPTQFGVHNITVRNSRVYFELKSSPDSKGRVIILALSCDFQVPRSRVEWVDIA